LEWMKLSYPLALILLKPNGGLQISSAFVDRRDRHKIQVPDRQIPLTPCTVKFVVSMADGRKFSIGRQQYALTGR